MKAALAFACVLALAGCKSKHDDASSDKPTGSATASGSATATAAPVVTTAQVTAVADQQSRLDELATLLDKADVVSGPIALLDAITKLPEWSMLVAKVDKLKTVTDVAAQLKGATQQLAVLQANLREASTRLTDLKGLLAQAAGGAKLDDLKQQVSQKLEGALEPLAKQVATTIQTVLGPLSAQLGDTADTIIGACAIAKLSSNSKDIVALCGKVKETFTLATAFLSDLKAKPSTLYAEVSAKLEAQLGPLIDTAVKQALDAAQAQVDAALKLPPASGSAAAGSGSGSAP